MLNKPIVKNKRSGFTLIELLVVIMILGILAALITGNFFTSLKKGRDAKRKSDLEQIQRALEMYYDDKAAYPTLFAFGSNLADPDSGKIYMQKTPNDPVPGKNYVYVSSGTDYKIYACLENDQQILPYPNALNPSSPLDCSTNCYAQDGTTKIKCIYGISSSNTTP